MEHGRLTRSRKGMQEGDRGFYGNLFDFREPHRYTCVIAQCTIMFNIHLSTS